MKKKLLAMFLILSLAIGTLTLCIQSDDAKQDTLPQMYITMGSGYDRFQLKGGDKETKYPGTTVKIVSGGKTIMLEYDVEIKGRGNFTWSLPKKPYQIKFSEKKNLLGMGKGKKWVLLANHTDTTFMRNPLAFELADRLGLPFTPDWRWVDLYLDGSYQGNYVVCEKVGIGSARVALESDYGVLVELDNNYGDAEPIKFESAKSRCIFTLKDSVADDTDQPDSKAREGFRLFKEKLTEFERILYSQNPDYDAMCELVDMESFIKLYFFQELAEDSDGLSSSFYLYMDGPDDVIHLGPVWDYDISFGNYENNPGRGSEPFTDYIFGTIYEMGRGRDPVSWYEKLWKVKAFEKAAVDLYGYEIMPVFNEASRIVTEWGNDPALQNSSRMNDEKYGLLGHSHVVGDNPRHYEDTYLDEVRHLAEWLEDRVAYLDARYVTGEYPEPRTEAPATQPPTEPPTEAPTEPPTQAPTEAPTQPPTEPDTEVPTEPVTEPPTSTQTDPSETETELIPDGSASEAETTAPAGCRSVIGSSLGTVIAVPTLFIKTRKRNKHHT